MPETGLSGNKCPEACVRKDAPERGRPKRRCPACYHPAPPGRLPDTAPSDLRKRSEKRRPATIPERKSSLHSACNSERPRHLQPGTDGAEKAAPSPPSCKRPRRHPPAARNRLTQKKAGLRKRRPDDTARKPHMTSNYFCSPRIRIATSRIVVSSSVTTPPSGPGSK